MAQPTRPLSQMSEHELEAALSGIPVAPDLVSTPIWTDNLPAIREWAAAHSLPTALAPTLFPDLEDRSLAVLSAMGEEEYVEDLIRPGRIVVVAGTEGTGKTVAIAGELGIRLAVAGGKFAETWQVKRTGPVAYLSEMHPDDDFNNEERVLSALGISRVELHDRYYRLSLATAANGAAPLALAEWREWLVLRVNELGLICLIVDTATTATGVTEPWGQDMQDAYRYLRAMLEVCPQLCIVLDVHMRKARDARAGRDISAVLGEWGRWCDVVLLMEEDGINRIKISSRKRVRQQRYLALTKRDYLLVDAVDLAEEHGPKVAMDQLLRAIEASPGMNRTQLAHLLDVSPATMSGYLKQAEMTRQVRFADGPRGSKLVFATRHPSAPVNGQADGSVDGSPDAEAVVTRHPSPTYIGDGSLLTGHEESEAELLEQL